MRLSAEYRWRSGLVRAFWKRVGGASPRRAVDIVSDELVTRLGRSEPPFQSDSYEYAQMLDIPVVESELPCDGSLSYFAKRFVVQVNKDAAPQRRSFTVCHEIGHIQILLRAQCSSPRPAQFVAEEEALADHFAANLVMPRVPFRAYAKDLTPSAASIKLLASIFFTSVEAAARRVIEVNAWPCAVIRCEPEMLGKNNRPRAAILQLCMTSKAFGAAIRGGARDRVHWLYDPAVDAINRGQCVGERDIKTLEGGTIPCRFECIPLSGTSSVIAILVPKS